MEKDEEEKQDQVNENKRVLAEKTKNKEKDQVAPN